MRQWYSAGKQALLQGDLGFDSDTLKAVLVTGYVFDDTDDVIADVAPTVVGDAVTVTGVSLAGGIVTCDPVVFEGVTGEAHVSGFVLYAQSGGTLIAYCDTALDTVPLDVEPNGGDLTFTFPNYLVKL